MKIRRIQTRRDQTKSGQPNTHRHTCAQQQPKYEQKDGRRRFLFLDLIKTKNKYLKDRQKQ